LGENVGDCFSYIQYVQAKNEAEAAQLEFENKMTKKKK
jgi:hypothetical protein